VILIQIINSKVEGQAAMDGMMRSISEKGKSNEIVRDTLLKTY